MALTLYDKKLLNFMYELTKVRGFLSNKALSKTIRLDNLDNVSEKTIQNWFKFLGKTFEYSGERLKKFQYYPRVACETLGLVPFFVIADEPKIEVLEMFPFQNFVFWGYDSLLRKRVLFTEHYIPFEYVSRFKEKWDKIKRKGLVADYEILQVRTGRMIYSPLHKVIEPNGDFIPERNDVNEVNYQVNEFLNEDVEKKHNVKVCREVTENPLLIPVISEHKREQLSSAKVWVNIKNNLGDSVWDYIRRGKIKSDGVGIKKVQEAMNQIGRLEGFKQMRVDYMPVSVKGFKVYLHLGFKNHAEMSDKLAKLCHSSSVSGWVPLNNNKNEVFGYVSLDNSTLQNCFDIIDDVDTKRILFQIHNKSLNLIRRFKRIPYQNLFDPKEVKWRDMDQFTYR